MAINLETTSSYNSTPVAAPSISTRPNETNNTRIMYEQTSEMRYV